MAEFARRWFTGKFEETVNPLTEITPSDFFYVYKSAGFRIKNQIRFESSRLWPAHFEFVTANIVPVIFECYKLALADFSQIQMTGVHLANSR